LQVATRNSKTKFGYFGFGFGFFAQLYSPPLEHVAEKLTPMQDGGTKIVNFLELKP
jgi:hypothetical protein